MSYKNIKPNENTFESIKIIQNSKKKRDVSQEKDLVQLEILNPRRKKKKNTVEDKLEKKDEPLILPAQSKPPRYLDPITFHVISGIFLFDDIQRRPDDFLELGIFSGINFLSKITGVGIDKENGFVGITLINKFASNTPWRLYQSRLISLGDAKAKDLCEPLEKFCLRGELVSTMPVQKMTDPKVNFFGTSVIELSSLMELGEKIINHLKPFDDAGVYAFVRKGKNLNLPQMNMIEVIVNKKLCEMVGMQTKDWAIHSLRSGFPEFISLDSYYEYWKSTFEEINGIYLPTVVKLKSKSGRLKYAETQRCYRRAFFYDGDFYILIVQSLRPLGSEYTVNSVSNSSDDLEKNEMEESLETQPFIPKTEEYMGSILPFFDRFYPKIAAKFNK